MFIDAGTAAYDTTRGIEQFGGGANSVFTIQQPPYKPRVESKDSPVQHSNDYLALGSTGTAESSKSRLLKTGGALGSSGVEPPSRAFAEFTSRKTFGQMLVYLHELKTNLNAPEGAALMVGFREGLAKALEVKDGLSKEKVLVISALEEAVRGKKWRELTPQQIVTMEAIIEHSKNSTVSAEQASAAFRSIHKSGIDIYPSAEIDDNDARDE
jgi:hypothetical protein